MLEGGTTSAAISKSCTLPSPSVHEQIDFGGPLFHNRNTSQLSSPQLGWVNFNLTTVGWKDRYRDIPDPATSTSCVSLLLNGKRQNGWHDIIKSLGALPRVN